MGLETANDKCNLHQRDRTYQEEVRRRSCQERLVRLLYRGHFLPSRRTAGRKYMPQEHFVSFLLCDLGMGLPSPRSDRNRCVPSMAPGQSSKKGKNFLLFLIRRRPNGLSGSGSCTSWAWRMTIALRTWSKQAEPVDFDLSKSVALAASFVILSCPCPPPNILFPLALDWPYMACVATYLICIRESVEYRKRCVSLHFDEDHTTDCQAANPPLRLVNP